MHPESDCVANVAFDDGNERELARHHFSSSEVLEVFDNEPLWGRNRRDRAGNRQAIGRTNGGRLLTVVALWDGDTGVLRPITAWDANPAERTSYLRSGKE